MLAREVHILTRTINEIGKTGRTFFKELTDVTGVTFSTFMHWGILVDNTVFELKGGITSKRTKNLRFVNYDLSPKQREEVHSMKSVGLTKKTNEEIFAIGCKYAEEIKYDMIKDNCQWLTNKILKDVLADSDTYSVETTVGQRLLGPLVTQKAGSFDLEDFVESEVLNVVRVATRVKRTFKSILDSL